jgi:hypothetical protein
MKEWKNLEVDDGARGGLVLDRRSGSAANFEFLRNAGELVVATARCTCNTPELEFLVHGMILSNIEAVSDYQPKVI